MKINWIDIALMAPGLLTLLVFLVLTYFTEGDANKGYTVFGSEVLGNIIFTYLVSLMVIGPIILGCFIWGVWRIVSRFL